MARGWPAKDALAMAQFTDEPLIGYPSGREAAIAGVIQGIYPARSQP